MVNSKELTPGILCFTRRPISKDNIDSSSNKRSQLNNDNGTISETIWWPSLIYPSWSEAANHGGLMKSTIEIPSSLSSSSKKRKTSTGVYIVGIQNKISIHHLKNNMVPKKVAMNYNKNKSNYSKKKVVVHYLGLAGNVDQECQKEKLAPSWTAATQDEVIPYSKNVLSVLYMYKNKIHRHDWQGLINAMKEASIATENSNLDPDHLLQLLSKEVKQLKKKVRDDENEGVNNTDTTQTPEFFDDWKILSRGSQSQSQSRLTQFSQVKSLSQHQSDLIDLDKKVVTPQQHPDAQETNKKNVVDDESSVMKKSGNKAVQFLDDQISCSTNSNSMVNNDDCKSVDTADTEGLVSDDILLTQA